MKRGLIVLKALVKLLPTLLISIALIAILYSLISSLTSSKTPEEQDFERIVNEMDELIKNPGEITVPLANPNGLLLRFFTKENSPPVCKNNPCVCVEYRKDGEPKHKCKQYKLSTCEDCSKACITQQPPIVLLSERKSITLTRRCNEVVAT